MLMTILAILLILCHASNLTCNLLRDRSIPEVVVPVLGVILSTLMLFPTLLVWGFSFSFLCLVLMMFFNTIRYGKKHLDTKSVLQYVIYGVSGLGILSSLILGVIWSCI